MGEIAERVTYDAELPPDTGLDSHTSTPLPTFEQRSRPPSFPKAREDTYLAYRLNAGKQDDFEKIPRCNEYFTQDPVLSGKLRFRPMTYIFDVEWFLKTFFDEILNAYSPTLQVYPPVHSVRLGSPIRMRVRNSKGTEQEVHMKRLSRKSERLFLDRAEVIFTGHLKQDILIIFSVTTFGTMNPHILKIMRHQLTQHQYEQALEYWRACEIRIQELRKRYESSLLEYLQT